MSEHASLLSLLAILFCTRLLKHIYSYSNLREPNSRLYSNYVQRCLIVVSRGERIISRNLQFEQCQTVRIFGQDNFVLAQLLTASEQSLRLSITTKRSVNTGYDLYAISKSAAF